MREPHAGRKGGERPGRNGGTLQTGNPGNRGGGRRPDEIRSLARASLERCLHRISERLEDQEIPTSELVRIAEVLLRYGIGPAAPESSLERPSAMWGGSL